MLGILKKDQLSGTLLNKDLLNNPDSIIMALRKGPAPSAPLLTIVIPRFSNSEDI